MSEPPRKLPERPPASVLEEVYAAHHRVEAMLAAGRSVDFGYDAAGRLEITLEEPGATRRLRPSEVLDLLD